MSFLRFTAVAVAIVAVIIGGLPYLDKLVSQPYPVPPPNGGVIVTGCSSGIGYNASVTLAQRGFTVFATVRKQADFEQLDRHRLPSLKPVIMDVSDFASIDQGWESIQATLKAEGIPLIGLVNNAGIAQYMPVEFHDRERMGRLFMTNLLGPMHLTQIVLPSLRQNQGRVIMMSSITSLVISPLTGAYSSTKRAMDSFADTLRLELRQFNVSVTTVVPAFVSTEIFGKTTKFIDEEVGEDIRTVYGSYYVPARRAKQRGYVAKASPPTVTTNAIYDALVNPYPKTRYVVANINGVPAWIPLMLAETLPTRVYDAILHFQERAYTTPK